jgi:hypothetical protein
LDKNAEETIAILRAIAGDPKSTLAIKVTSMTTQNVLLEMNVGQKRLYDMFVEIAGYDVNAYITKKQVI